MTLNKKLVVTSCSILILVAGILTAISIVTMKGQITKDLTSNMLNYGQASSNQISTWLKDKRQVVTALKGVVEANPNNDDIILRSLRQTIIAANLSSLVYGLKSKDAFFRRGKNVLKNYDVTKRGWYQTGLENTQMTITEPYEGKSSKALLISIVQQTQQNGQFHGVLSANVNLSGIDDVVSAMAVPGNGYAFIVSDSGKVISYPANTPDSETKNDFNNKPLAEVDASLNLKLIQENSHSQELSSINVQNTDYLMSSQRIQNTPWTLVLLGNKDILMSPVTNLGVKQVVVALILMLASVVVLTLLIRTLMADLLRVSNALEDIAQGEGDLTVQIKTDNQDEVGQLATNFNAFVLKLRDIIKNIDQLTHDLFEQAMSSANSVENSTKRLNVQQDELISVASAVEEMTSATQEIAHNAEMTADNSNKTVTVSGNGQKLSGASLNSISQLAQEVTSASQVITELNKQGDKINSIVSTISDIAEQTNLLALNAAIEAARAGEQGRGFAVVADEVRVLSQKTHASTEEISAMISNLQTTTTKAVKVMGLCHDLANTSVDDTQKSGENFSEIAKAIEQINMMTVQIATAAEEQTSVTAEIGKNTVAVRDVSSELLEEMSEGLKQANDLKTLAESLREQVNKFKL
ncbi:methyl-accepting chemotaxis protein [Marinomonas aquiplantarum]|uniref:Methyl-accepting chemotaxis protein n=1 Tax=Marinomonas aquiplantarum TaxID=491951 RepID=A0A366CVR0_9GAMM|nr:methyl-accepting chemotaxis protein [Marinomonas aquiplantarum]RBO81932.1 methyl-accepting chemotaxis protein [Marinomonas aquiplantarum]